MQAKTGKSQGPRCGPCCTPAPALHWHDRVRGCARAADHVVHVSRRSTRQLKLPGWVADYTSVAVYRGDPSTSDQQSSFRRLFNPEARWLFSRCLLSYQSKRSVNVPPPTRHDEAVASLRIGRSYDVQRRQGFRPWGNGEAEWRNLQHGNGRLGGQGRRGPVQDGQSTYFLSRRVTWPRLLEV